jgi:hypothetical protein
MAEKNDPHIGKIVDRFRDGPRQASSASVALATHKVLRLILEIGRSPKPVDAVLQAVQVELPEAGDRQIEVVLRQCHRSGMIILRNRAVTCGPTFLDEH